MNNIDANPANVLAWLVLVVAIVGPTIYRLVRRSYRAYKIRQHKKTIPGPLLGVIYPKDIK